jgi:3-isopropylmalate/(R)-2-methylmalate dehydratase small subunit
MQPFTRLSGLAASLPEANIDTDIIFPARFLLITAKSGLGQYAFYERRHAPDGTPREDFILNTPEARGAPILLAGDNFGCGSSREQAVWALADLSVRCVISSSFGEIFYANCLKNGLLPVVVGAAPLARLMADAAARLPIEIDLADQCVRRRNRETIAFSIEPWRREALLGGLDEISFILDRQTAAIAAFEAHQRTARPWLNTGD